MLGVFRVQPAGVALDGWRLASVLRTGWHCVGWRVNNRRAAQALVEFALAISTFMLLVLGTFDVARAYLAYTVVSNAAREASRYGVAHVGETGWDASAVQVG